MNYTIVDHWGRCALEKRVPGSFSGTWSSGFPCIHGSCALAHFLALFPQQFLDHASLLLHSCMMSSYGADDVATVHILFSGDADMNVFVGNLAFTTPEQDLRQLFEPYGTVETVRMMTDHETGRARGFGFVEMPDSRVA